MPLPAPPKDPPEDVRPGFAEPRPHSGRSPHSRRRGAAALALLLATVTPPLAAQADETKAPPAAVETPADFEVIALPETPSAGARHLLALIDTHDGRAMYAELARRLEAGRSGFAEIHEFLHLADLDRPKILDLTHDPVLLYALLRLASTHKQAVADCTRYLLDATRDRHESFIRREVFNFAPVFVNFYPGKFPALRQRVKRGIDRQIELRGDYMYKVLLAIRDLDYAPPPQAFIPYLEDRGQSHGHTLVVNYLVTRGDQGLRALQEFATRKGVAYPTVPHALRAVSLAAREDARKYLQPFLESEDLATQATAVQAYFEYRRDADDVELALDFLNSAIARTRKQALVRSIRRRSVEALDAIHAFRERIEDPIARADVEKAQAFLEKRRQRQKSADEKKES